MAFTLHYNKYTYSIVINLYYVESDNFYLVSIHLHHIFTNNLLNDYNLLYIRLQIFVVNLEQFCTT